MSLGQLRAMAKRLKPQPDLARELWRTDATAAQLLSMLISRPKRFTAAGPSLRRVLLHPTPSSI